MQDQSFIIVDVRTLRSMTYAHNCAPQQWAYTLPGFKPSGNGWDAPRVSVDCETGITMLLWVRPAAYAVESAS